MTSLEHNTTNDNRLSDFMAEVREFGRDEAAGKDALPKLAMSVVRAVADGVVDIGKDKDGNDAASRIYHEYVKARAKKQIHDRSDAGLKANISKLRQIVNFAASPKWDPVDVMNRAFTIRQGHEDDDIAVKPAYAAYVDVAREQLKQDTPLTDEQIGVTVMATSRVKEVTLEGELKKIQKKMEDLITGEGTGALRGVQDNSPELEQAHELITQRLAAMLTKQQQDEAVEKALAAGFVLGEDGTLRRAA